MKALKEQNEASVQAANEVEEFLEQAQAGFGPKYREVFLDNGVEDLETILEMDDKHLEQMGVPLGHKLKMLKRIKEVRADKGMYVPPSRQGGRE
jgi:SAM domain (Sterile alpha motif)